jgi:hypothetical protein
MHTIWHIKIIGCLAVMAAPLLSVFTCPCDEVYAASDDEVAEKVHCCECAAEKVQPSCCKKSGTDPDAGCKRSDGTSCEGNSCKCYLAEVYAHFIALVPEQQRLDAVIFNSNAVEYSGILTACNSKAVLMPDIHTQTPKIPLHILKRALLC